MSNALVLDGLPIILHSLCQPSLSRMSTGVFKALRILFLLGACVILFCLGTVAQETRLTKDHTKSTPEDAARFDLSGFSATPSTPEEQRIAGRINVSRTNR